MTTTLINLARTIATNAHHGVYRADGSPYIAHPAAVAEHAAIHYSADDHTIAACWLHDVVEDTTLSLDDLAALGIPSPVLAAVEAVTVQRGEAYLDAIARAATNRIARLVKISDNWHNSTTLTVFSEADRRRRAMKYQAARDRLLTVS